MPALTGIFATLPGIENIPPEGIQKWVKIRLSAHAIENFLANRIMYPQTIPVTEEDKAIDQAILQEYINTNQAYFYNPLSHRLLIPSELIARFKPLDQLLMVFCSLLNLSGVIPLFIIEENTLQNEGSILVPQISSQSAKLTVVLNGSSQSLEIGKFYHFQVPDQRNRVKLGDENEMVVAGGKAGITIDLRKRGV